MSWGQDGEEMWGQDGEEMWGRDVGETLGKELVDKSWIIVRESSAET